MEYDPKELIKEKRRYEKIYGEPVTFDYVKMKLYIKKHGIKG